MAEITRRFEFDAAHRVLGHEGKCANLHGHRYVALVTVETAELDTLGRVIDYSVLKEEIGRWIDRKWDHNTLLNSDDPLVSILGDQSLKELEKLPPSETLHTNLKMPYVFEKNNPTAENIAAYLLTVCKVILNRYPELEVTKVEVFETPNCSAVARAKGKK